MADERFGGQELRSRFPQSPRRAARAHRVSSSSSRTARPDRRYAIDCAERELGYRAEVTLASGLRSTFDWYVENEWWWRAVMDGSYQRWIETHYR